MEGGEAVAIEGGARDEAAERLDEYNALCMRLVPGEEAHPRVIARYIGDVLHMQDELDELRLRNTSLAEQVASLQEALAGAPAAGSDASLVAALEEACHEKDATVARLTAELGEAQAALAATREAPLPLPEEEGPCEDSLVEIAEREIKLMEELISEQEEYIRRIEEGMAASRKAVDAQE